MFRESRRGCRADERTIAIVGWGRPVLLVIPSENYEAGKVRNRRRNICKLCGEKSIIPATQ